MKHYLPEIKTISETRTEQFSKHQGEITVLLNDFLLKYLNSLYEEFQGDFIMAIVLGEIAHHNISGFMQNGAIRNEFKDISLRQSPGFKPCNPFSISESTGIPRETVRRKFMQLHDDELIKKTSTGGYIISHKAAERFSDSFNVRLFDEFIQLTMKLKNITT